LALKNVMMPHHDEVVRSSKKYHFQINFQKARNNAQLWTILP